MNESLGFKDRVAMGFGKGLPEGINFKGHMKVEVFGESGKLKDIREIDNTVTLAAKYGIMDQLLATPNGVGYTSKPGWMELGTGTGQTASSTTLATYISGSRTVLDSKTRASAVITMICTFPAGTGTNAAITEAGIFDVVTQNTAYLWTYASFGAIAKASGDSMVITWTLTAS